MTSWPYASDAAPSAQNACCPGIDSDIQADIPATDGLKPWQAVQKNGRVRRDIGRRATCDSGKWQGTMGLGRLYLRT